MANARADEGSLILVVDDDAEVLRLLAGALRTRGYRVAVARDGHEGLARVRAEVPRLIVLDYWMPVLDGAGFMEALRGMVARRPPVILFTAVHDKPDLARNLGVDVYVEKPVQITRFLKLVEATLRGAPSPQAAAPEGSERRRRPRLIHRRRVDVRLPGQVQVAAAFTIDVSEGGLCLELSEPAHVPMDAPVAVSWRTEDGHDVRIDGRVRHLGGARVGVQFLPLDAHAQAAVRALLSEAGGLGLQATRPVS